MNQPRHALLSIERKAVFQTILFAIVVLGLPLLFGTAAKIFNDGDTGWHLAAGRWILEHRQIPRVDSFSFTMTGQPWTAHEWLADTLLAAASQFGGYAGVAALVTAALAMLHALIYRRAVPSVAPAVIFFTFVGLVLVLAPFILARPHVLVWPVMALWTSVLLDSSDARRPPPWWLPALMILWVNLHGSFLLALVIYGAIGLDALLSGNHHIRRWIVIGVLSAAATLVNANGVSALFFPFTVAGMDTLHLITEWRPSRIDRTPFFFLVVAVTVAALLWRKTRVPPARLLLLLFLLTMALFQMRHQTWFVIAAALILPRCLAGSPVGTEGGRPSLVSSRLTGVAPLIPALIALWLPISPANGASFPRVLIAAVPRDLRAQPVFNEYSFGGPLIFAGIRPYIDGRADMYGDAFFADYARIDEGDFARFEQAVERYGIRWTILQHSNRRLIKALDASPDWRRLAADDIGVIHVRTVAQPLAKEFTQDRSKTEPARPPAFTRQ